MSGDPFWSTVRSRRNVLYAWTPIWVVAGTLAVIGYRGIFDQQPQFAFGIALLVVYAVVGWFLQRRLLSLTCPRCGKRAFGHGLFFMRHAKCQHCEYANSAPNP